MNSIVFVSIIILFKSCICFSSPTDTLSEELLIKPLPSGHVYAHFQFPIRTDNVVGNQHAFKHFRLFPRSLGEIISKHSVQELHFSLTQGLWRHEKWGYPIRDAPPGAELWAWFQPSVSDVQGTWKNLVNALSGQFCASLNFINEANTVSPRLSFRPEGAVMKEGVHNSSFLRYSSLPRETACTENLTPFKKLLPCDTKAGLSTLLNAVHVLNSNYFSLAVDLRTVCKNEECTATAIELKPSLSVVFDPPIIHQGKQDWSFVKLFGAGLNRLCPLASQSKVYVDMSRNETGIPFTLVPEPLAVVTENEKTCAKRTVAVYDLSTMFGANRQVNIAASYKKPHIYWYTPPPVIYANRHVAGFGLEQGGIHCSIYNNHPSKPIKVIYLEVVPWLLRLYSHTLTITNNGKVIKPEYQHYQPARDRRRPHHLEFVFTLPPNSVTEISIEFRYAFLKWTEYPPDANHGFYVGSSVISTLVDSDKNFTFMGTQSAPQQSYFLRLHTPIILVSLPTPDFSMPYNVICLSCTVMALAFGPIHNVTTKRLVLVSEKKKKNWLFEVSDKLRIMWKGKPPGQAECVEDTTDSKKEQ